MFSPYADKRGTPLSTGRLGITADDDEHKDRRERVDKGDPHPNWAVRSKKKGKEAFGRFI